MTLLELLIAMSIMVLVVGTLGTLAKAVQDGFEYSEGHGLATQHARVILERIARTVGEATASKRFPGAIVLAEEEGPWRFPDTLVVWHPDEKVLQAHPERLPLNDLERKTYYDELIIYCPDWDKPNKLMEITPTDTQTVPWVVGSGVNVAQLTTKIQTIRQSAAGEPPLTEMMRTCAIDNGGAGTVRAAVRFETRLRPSDEEWAEYEAIPASNLPLKDAAWKTLPWVQGIYGSRTGLRQVWVRIELQLMPNEEMTGGSDNGQRAIPFFGSTARYYEMHR